MLSLIILKLPNLFIFFPRLGTGHPLKLCLGLSPSTLKIKVLFRHWQSQRRNASVFDESTWKQGEEAWVWLNSLSKPQGHRPTRRIRASLAYVLAGGGQFCQTQSRGGSSRSADAERPRVKEWEECACSEDGSDRDSPFWPPVREKPAPHSCCHSGCHHRRGACGRAAGSVIAGAGPATAAASALTLAPDHSAVSSSICATAFPFSFFFSPFFSFFFSFSGQYLLSKAEIGLHICQRAWVQEERPGWNS